MELEKQFLEVDRLSVENSALSQVASFTYNTLCAAPLYYRNVKGVAFILTPE